MPIWAQKELTQKFAMPVQLQVNVDLLGCENSPGPQITLSGAVKLGGLNTDLIFRNNVKGTHTYTAESSVAIVAVPAGGSIVIPKQPVLGGVGGNPFIWVQPIGTEKLLGRCVQLAPGN